MTTPLDKDMFHEIMSEIRAIRQRIDKHVDDEETKLETIRKNQTGISDYITIQLDVVKKEISDINKQLHGQKIKIAGLVSIVSIIATWVYNKVFF